MELYLDQDNYCVFTTSRIYSCINTRLEIIEHKDILDIDDYSLALASRNRPADVWTIQFDLQMRDGKKAAILCESGIPLRSLFGFFSFVRDANKTG